MCKKGIIYIITVVMLAVSLLFTIHTERAEAVEVIWYYETTIEGDRVITYEYKATHALNILKVLAKLRDGHITREYDVNADGLITIDDAVLALKSAAKLIKIQFSTDYFYPE